MKSNIVVEYGQKFRMVFLRRIDADQFPITDHGRGLAALAVFAVTA